MISKKKNLRIGIGSEEEAIGVKIPEGMSGGRSIARNGPVLIYIPSLNLGELEQFEEFVNLKSLDIYNIITVRMILIL